MIILFFFSKPYTYLFTKLLNCQTSGKMLNVNVLVLILKGRLLTFYHYMLCSAPLAPSFCVFWSPLFSYLIGKNSAQS